MKVTLNSFGEFLIKHNFLSEDLTQKAWRESQQQEISFINYLNDKDYVNSHRLADAVAMYFKMPRGHLNEYDLTQLPLNSLSFEQIKKQQILPVFLEDNYLSLATCDPSNVNILEINFLTGMSIKFIIVEKTELYQAIHELYAHNLQQQYCRETEPFTQLYTIDNSSVQNSPAVDFLDSIFKDVLQKNASDIHFEPFADFYRIRYRVDGILYEMAKPPMTIAKFITARLKVLANLDIAERRLPQDGRFTLNTSLGKHDIRVSTCPTLFGEKCVLRILKSAADLVPLSQLGMQDLQLSLFQESIKQPQGMILVTGPTGSGKTTTLYSALNSLDSTSKNILTVEDPIEIPLSRINQVQVNLKTKMTFERTLRNFLRQDPDVIMVGEIRDLTTAQTAVNAAQTGHLVFSSLHTNNALETLFRFMNLGVTPYNIISSLLLIVAQRLVRKLCPNCKKKTRTGDFISYEPVGCQCCIQGYRGRIGIFEIVHLSETMKEMIVGQASLAQLQHQTQFEKYLTLMESALAKVQAGITSLSETQRVLGMRITP